MKKIKFLLISISCVVVACNSSEDANNSLNQYEYVENTEVDEPDKSMETGNDSEGLAVPDAEYNYIIPESINLSTKKEDSQCLIKSVYSENGLVFVDVDFILFQTVDIGDGLEGTEIVNNNPKIRTYVLSRENENLPSEEEIRSFLEYDPESVFYIATEDGYVLRLLETGLPG